MKRRILLFNLALGLLLTVLPSQAQDLSSLQGVTEKRPWSATSDPATAGAAIYEMMTTDLRQQIAATKSPVLLLAAADFAPDAASRKQLASSYEAQLANVPQARVVLAERARHFIMLDDPAFLLSTMDAFLKEARP